MARNKLWYDQPAQAWVEALPLGNGRIGAMVFGGTSKERIALNEDSLWSGYPRDLNVQGAAGQYKKAQQMVQRGEYKNTQNLIEETMLGPFTQSYMPLGDLLLDFGELGDICEYTRCLTLEDAVHTSSFRAGGTGFSREVFVSAPGQAMFVRLSADKPGSLSFSAGLQSQLKSQVRAEDGLLLLCGVAPSQALPVYVNDPDPVTYSDDPAQKGMRFCAAVKVLAKGGTVTAKDGRIHVSGAEEAVLQFAARTSFCGFDKHPFLDGPDPEALCLADLHALSGKEYAPLKEEHISSHRELYGRVSFSLEGADYRHQTTAQRLRNYPGQQDDLSLVELIFQFGRYLLISASRPGTQATNLQGIWNDQLRAPWSSNYTVNINTQMNYWPTELVALPELHQPLFDLIDELSVTGAQTAKVHYGAGGSVAHHNVDIWRLSNPVGNKGRGTAGYAFWPMSFGWLCGHLMEHYLFTGDKQFLRSRALPNFQKAARFFLDVLYTDDQGRMMITPATSPENSFMAGGERQNVSKSSTMSNTIVREVFENYLAALSILEVDDPMAGEVAQALPKLYPFEIGSKGQLLEWECEFEEPEPHHRHTSHLYALHPSRQITPEGTPALADACRQTLALRGDDGTGWSLGWKINFWARLQDGDHAFLLLRKQLRLVESEGAGTYNMANGGGTYLNLFDAHPPFQIDGNYGACSGIAEMLLSTNGQRLHLLPALPAAWANGKVCGLRAHGGLSVDIEFRQGKLRTAKITRVYDIETPVHVACQGRTWTLCPKKGETVTLTP